MIALKLSSASNKAQKALLVLQSAVLATVGMAPLMLTSSVSAAPQLPNRELRITTARPGQTFDTTFEFDTTAVSSDVERIEIEFCDSPLGSCTIVNTPTIPASSTVSQLNWASGTSFGTYTRSAGTSGGSNNMITVSRTSATSEGSGNNLQIGFTGLTNNATANRSYYPRIRLYDAPTAGTLQWEGVVAQSTSQTLTVNARVQEVLAFCVGATAVDDATTSVGAACSNVTGTDVDLGVVDSGAISYSPVSTVNGGDNENGVAMIRTNAVNGAVIDYKSVQDTSSGALKVVGATCSGVSLTDQCFNSVGTTQAALAAGTENFGMTIAGINCGSTTSYTCTFSAGTYNLVRDTAYDGAGTNTYTTGTGNGFAWDDTGTVDRIASSAGSAVKVVDDEAMILKFAATSSITTPTGQYTVQADFIATPTF
jgi:hypothetical protein